MYESCEKRIKIGFTRNVKHIFDEIDQLSAEMIRNGWMLKDTCIEDGLGQVHLFFERQISNEKNVAQ